MVPAADYKFRLVVYVYATGVYTMAYQLSLLVRHVGLIT